MSIRPSPPDIPAPKFAPAAAPAEPGFNRGLLAGAVLASLFWASVMPVARLADWSLFGEAEAPVVPLILSTSPPRLTAFGTVFTICGPFEDGYRRSLRWPTVCARKA